MPEENIKEKFYEEYRPITKDTASFYRDKTWEMLFDNIKAIQQAQDAQAKDISDIKGQIKWIIGIATGITVVFNILFVYLRNQITKIFS